MAQERKDYSIILIGNAGVGKSTFLNAILNYLSFETLDEAEKTVTKYAIPFKFNALGKEIAIPGAENENFAIGAAVTKCATYSTYEFELKDNAFLIVYLISSLNSQNILDLIVNSQNIHAICILLNPDKKEFNKSYKIFIRKFLKHLPENARKNVMFIYTNSRNTLNNSGSTKEEIIKMLTELKNDRKIEIPYNETDEDNLNEFWFENDAFKYLCCSKKNIKIDNKWLFSASWELSVKEISKLMKRICSTPSIQIKSLNKEEARRILTDLILPLSQLSQRLVVNICLLENKIEQLSRARLDIIIPSQDFHIPQLSFKPIVLASPRMICTSFDCFRKVRNTPNQSYFKCHDNCTLQNQHSVVVNDDILLKTCPEMTNGKCEACKCDWGCHMRIIYELGKEEVKNSIHKIENDKSKEEQVNTFIELAQKELKELREERDKLIKILVELTCLEKQFEIYSFNDDLKIAKLEQKKDSTPFRFYLKKCYEVNVRELQVEEHLNMKTYNINALEGFIAFKEQYKRFDCSKINVNGLNDVKLKVEELFKMKHNGKSILNIFKMVQSKKTDGFKINENQTIILAKS